MLGIYISLLPLGQACWPFAAAWMSALLFCLHVHTHTYLCACVCACASSCHSPVSISHCYFASKLKCFATHSNKNICTHSHTHTHAYEELARTMPSWTIWELPRCVVCQFRDEQLLRYAYAAWPHRCWRGLPYTVCLCRWWLWWLALGHLLCLSSIQFGWQPVYQHLHQCLPHAAYARVFNSLHAKWLLSSAAARFNKIYEMNRQLVSMYILSH